MPSKFTSMAIALVLIIPLIGVWFMAMPEPVHACSCVLEEGISMERADVVFMGGVISVERRPEPNERYWSNKFAVSTVWKGPATETLDVYTQGAACEIDFKVGKIYLVYGFYYEGLLRTGMCSAFTTSELEQLLPDHVYELGKGEMPGVHTELALGLAFAVLLSGMLWLGWRTRRVG